MASDDEVNPVEDFSDLCEQSLRRKCEWHLYSFINSSQDHDVYVVISTQNTSMRVYGY